jgi:hypothetical protein
LLFNYSEAEWSAIEGALPSARRGVPLNEEEKDFLRAIAESFRRPQSQRPSDRTKRWKELARVCKKAEALLVEAEALLVKLETADQSFLPKGVKRIDEVAIRERERAIKQAAIRGPLEVIKNLRGLAEEKSVTLRMRLTQLQPKSARLLDPRARNSVWYQGSVLGAWVIFGGELKIARHPTSGKVRGPLWRFFEAVARPVMGKAMPAVGSLPDIVGRQKRRNSAAFTWFQAAEPEWFDEWLELESRNILVPRRQLGTP